MPPELPSPSPFDGRIALLIRAEGALAQAQLWCEDPTGVTALKELLADIKAWRRQIEAVNRAARA